MRVVSNPSLLFAIAGISMSFAGFSGLFLALRPRDARWSGRDVGQIKTIVTFALTALFSALLVVPLASLIGEAPAVRAMAAATLVVEFYGHQVRVGTAWSRWGRIEHLTRHQLLTQGWPFAILAVVEQVLLLAVVLQPITELYELAVISMLGTPAWVFVIVVSQVGDEQA